MKHTPSRTVASLTCLFTVAYDPLNGILTLYLHSSGGSISKGRYAKLAHTKADYAAIYRSIAQYYSLPLWSYRDIAWSSFAEVNQSFFVDELKFSPGGYTFLHPPWYLHLFYADLLAALLVREFSTCSQKSHLSSSKHVSLTDEHKLPAALTASETNLCVNAPDALLLSVSYDHEPSQTNTTSALPSYNVTQRTGLWEHRQDSKGRYGLISELKAGEQVKLITFGFNNSHLQLESSIHLVSIRYLRSYSHAGRFDVYLCDKFAIGLDALWKQYKTYRVSSIENAEIILNPLGRNKYSKQRFCVGERYPTISIHHFQYRDQHFKARSNLQKIKINSIKICRIDTTYSEDNF